MNRQAEHAVDELPFMAAGPARIAHGGFLFDWRENHNRADRSTLFGTHFVPEMKASEQGVSNTLAGAPGSVQTVLHADPLPAETSGNPVNPGLSAIARPRNHRMNICGFYVTGADKSCSDAGKAGFALFF
jgi:hypothetical protein